MPTGVNDGKSTFVEVNVEDGVAVAVAALLGVGVGDTTIGANPTPL